jgi:putative endonuclease
MKYYVYILYSQSRDRYYIGYTRNPQERLQEHNLGATNSTRPGRPWIMAYKEEFENRSIAIRREREIKSKKNRKFLETLIKSQTIG